MPPASPVTIRRATADDAAACAAIYAPYVDGTVVTFELVAPEAEEFATRIGAVADDYGWLVAEQGGTVVGYAYAHRFNSRAAYDWSCETSIYLDRNARGHGIGRALAPLDSLARQGYRRAFAGITMPNEPSVGIHRSFGFEPCGVYRRVGWKHGSWHDVAWFQRDLQPEETDPPAPVTRIGDEKN